VICRNNHIAAVAAGEFPRKKRHKARRTNSPSLELPTKRAEVRGFLALRAVDSGVFRPVGGAVSLTRTALWAMELSF
jgi:hypothetical protein